MLNPSYYNPAWIGAEKEAFAAFQHRTQWAGYDATLDPGGAPSTQLLTLVIPMQSKLSGVGLSLSNDRTGPLSSMQAKFSLSVKKELNVGTLFFGVMPSIHGLSIDPSFRYNDSGDNLIPDAKGSQYRPNLGAGIYFLSGKDYFIGVSAENILKPSFDFGTDAENKIETNYLLLGGTQLNLSREVVLKPSVLVRSDLSRYSFEFSALVFIQEKMWGGVSYRKSEAISILVGYSFLDKNKLKIGYSFDYVIANQEAKQTTSHEVFLRFDLPNLVFGGRKAVKTPRFTF